MDGELKQPSSATREPAAATGRHSEPAVLRQSGGTVYRASGDRYLLSEIRATRPRYDPAAPRPCAGRALRRACYRCHRHHAGHALAPGPLRQRRLRREAVLDCLSACEAALPVLRMSRCPCVLLHLPLSWDDPATQLAMRKYTQSYDRSTVVPEQYRVHFAASMGLHSIDDVQRIVFDEATSCGVGRCLSRRACGDAPRSAASPCDTKYNPARTWRRKTRSHCARTFCVYGMEGPGGYQFVDAPCKCGIRTTRP